jgi:hypothetical protein
MILLPRFRHIKANGLQGEEENLLNEEMYIAQENDRRSCAL